MHGRASMPAHGREGQGHGEIPAVGADLCVHPWWRGGAVPNVGAWHASPVALSTHNAAKADTAPNDTLPHRRRMRRHSFHLLHNQLCVPGGREAVRM